MYVQFLACTLKQVFHSVYIDILQLTKYKDVIFLLTMFLSTLLVNIQAIPSTTIKKVSFSNCGIKWYLAGALNHSFVFAIIPDNVGGRITLSTAVDCMIVCFLFATYH